MQMQQKAGHGLVHGTLDGTTIVIDKHRQHSERMQDIEPEYDLLQGAARNAANKHTWRQAVFKTGNDQAGFSGQQIEAAILQGDKRSFIASDSKSLF